MFEDVDDEGDVVEPVPDPGGGEARDQVTEIPVSKDRPVAGLLLTIPHVTVDGTDKATSRYDLAMEGYERERNERLFVAPIETEIER